MNILFALAIAMAVGMAMTRLIKLIHLPNVTAYLIAGLLVGPYVLKVLTPEMNSKLSIISDVALGFTAGVPDAAGAGSAAADVSGAGGDCRGDRSGGDGRIDIGVPVALGAAHGEEAVPGSDAAGVIRQSAHTCIGVAFHAEHLCRLD